MIEEHINVLTDALLAIKDMQAKIKRARHPISLSNGGSKSPKRKILREAPLFLSSLYSYQFSIQTTLYKLSAKLVNIMYVYSTKSYYSNPFDYPKFNDMHF